MQRYSVVKLNGLFAVRMHDWNEVIGDHYIIIKRGFTAEISAQLYADILNAKFIAKGAV